MKKLLVLCVSVLMLAACQKKNDPIANVREAAKDPDLQGKNFVSECSAKPLDALFTGFATLFETSIKGSQTQYRFQGANVTRTTRFFTAADCSGDAAYTYDEKGTISINKDSKYKSNDGGYLIDFDFANLKISIGSPDGAKVANDLKLCGATDWAQGKDRDVSAQSKDLSCYGAQLPRHVSNRYRVDANVLLLGTATKGEKTDSQRPANLDMGTKYTAK